MQALRQRWVLALATIVVMAGIRPTLGQTLSADAGAGWEVCVSNSVIIGGDPTASGGNGPYTYSWSPADGLNDPTLANPTATPASTALYTVTVTDANNNTDSSSVTVIVDPVSVGGQAAAQRPSVCSGIGTSIGLSGQSGTIVRWQSSADGGTTWSNLALTLNPLVTGPLRVTTAFRAFVQNGVCGVATSSVAVVTIQSPPAITQDTSNQTVCAGVPVTWSVSAQNGVFYQWQRDGTNLVEGSGNFTGTTSPTLNNSAVGLEDAVDEAHGYICLVNGFCGTTNSSRVALSVDPVSVGGEASADVSPICSGTGASISLSNYTGIILHWQSSVDGGSNWSAIASSSNPLATGALTVQTAFRAVVQSGVCGPATSSPAIVAIDPVSVGGVASPAVSHVCRGSGTSIGLSSQTGTILNWQSSADGGSNWVNVASTNNSITTGPLTVVTAFRAVVQSGVCAPTTSSPAVVTIDTAPVITTDISNQTVCAGTVLTWSVGASGTGLRYQWQRYGTNLVEAVGNFAGTTSATLTNTAVGPQDAAAATNGYLCVVSGACSPAVTSSRVSLQVNPVSVGGIASPTASPICSGTGTSISLSNQTGAIVDWQSSVDGGSTWSDLALTNNPLVTGPLTVATAFRAVVHSGVCGPAMSSAATVVVDTPPAIITDISNQTVCAGSAVTWTVGASGTNLRYQWQRDGTNLVEGVGNFTGTTSPVLTNSAAGPGDALGAARGYVCAISGSCNPATNSSRVSLAVDPVSVGGAASPAASRVCSGTGTSISLSAQTGAIVKWQSSLDGGSTWSDIALTNNPLVTGPLTVATAFRAVVQSGVCGTATSSAITVMIDPVSAGGVASPGTSNVCSGTGTTISLSGQTGAIVKWQSLADGSGSWADLASTNNPLATGPLTVATEFRAVVQSGACGAATSSVATVTVEVGPAITTDISNQTVCAGAAVTWSVGASGSGLSYQWQRDGTNLLERAGNFTGTTSSTLTNSTVSLADTVDAAHGYMCLVSGSCGSTTASSRASLQVYPASAGGVASPGASPVCNGTGTTISLSGQTGTIVKWQSSVDGGSTWLDIALTNNPLVTDPLTVATAFRAVVQSGVCGPAISSAATVMIDPVGGVATPTTSPVCSGTGTTVSLAGQTGAIVKWQSSADRGSNWVDVASTNNPLATGSLTVATAFRAVVQSGICGAATSSVAVVTIGGAPLIATDLSNQTACAGMVVTWSVGPSLNGLSYQWQRDGTNLVEGVGNFTGTTNSTLTNSAVGLEDAVNATHGYMCLVSGSCGPATNSSKVSLVVEPVSVGGMASPTASRLCSGTGTTVGLSGQTGTIVTWQSSVDGGSSWSDLASTSNPLPTGPLTVTTAFRAVVQSGVCGPATSTTATVAIQSAPVITTDLSNQTVCAGMAVTWSVGASLSGLSYQWQRDGTNLIEGAGNFTGTTGSTLTNSAVGLGDAVDATHGYMCLVSGSCGPATNSSKVSLEVDGVPVGGAASPAASFGCSGIATAISLSGQAGLIAKWQSSVDGGLTWSDLASTNNPLSTGPLTMTTAFRAVVQSGACSAVYSSVAVVNVDVLSARASFAPIACHGGSTIVTVTATNGAEPYIGTGQFTVTAGSHTYAVSDTNGCTSSVTINITEPAVLSASATFTPICHGGSSTVTVSATGGTPPYQGTGSFTATAGSHTYAVSDTNGCTTSVTVNITEPPVLVASAGAGQEIVAGTPAIIGGSPTASGGTPGYTYHWSPTAGLNNPSAANCIATPTNTTVYTITVTDTNGCTASASVTVTVDPAPPHEPLGPSSRRTPIVFSEIMWKPAPRTDGNNLEFIELFNSNPWFQDISGYQVVCADMSYTFPAGTVIQGGSYLVIAASPQSIQNVYGITNVMGPYAGSLKKSETLQLLDEQGAVLLEVPYSNVYPWPVAAEGTGHSIVLANPTYGEGDPRAWAISDTVGGSPGRLDVFHPSPLRDVVINELLAHSEVPSVPQFVELYNHSTQSNDLSGCILTDDPTTNKFVIPAGTLIGPGGFVSFNEAQLGFELNGGGETIYFIKPDGSRILDAIRFEAQADGVSLGRWPDGANAYYPLVSRTPGTNNSDILVNDIVINELMYKPISGNDDDQYIELFNKGVNVVNLGGGMFTAGVKFTFPSSTTLVPGGYLVIARNVTNLLAKYPNLNAGNTLGNYSGALAHKGERVALAMPQLLTRTNGQGGSTTNTIYVVQDEVTYGTGGRWGQWAAGGGSSLELIDPRANHRLAANWADSDETQKSAWTNIEATGVLDNGANYDPSVDYAQIGLLDVGECLVDNIEVRAGTSGPNLVLNPDFEGGLANWSLQGDHSRSSLDSPGYASSYALHLRSSDRIWTGVNSCQVGLSPNSLAAGQTATLRFKARWLHGWPEALLRLNGNWLEATGPLPVPSNLGTPGMPNSTYVSNAGPAVYEVQHAPAIPAAGQAVVVTACAHDPDAVQSLMLYYRLDPATSYVAMPMKDDGTGGDAIAGDGVFSATIPGQSANSIVAFYIAAADARGAATRFPSLLNDNSLIRECVVMFGDANPAGSFGTYHLWITQTNVTRWSQLSDLSNEGLDCTMVCGTRIIYNAQAHYQGSPYHQTFDTPYGNLCNYKWTFQDDDAFLGATSFNKLHQPGELGNDNSLQREQTANTLLRALGVPWLYRRYVAVYVNGNRRGTLMEDAQTPDADVVNEHFPNDSDGWMYKTYPWFEFPPQPIGYYIPYTNNSWCNLMPYTTTGGAKKTARYRWTFMVRRTPDSDNNFTNVFALVDAASSYGSSGYASNMQALADMENWMRVFAAGHAAGDWDAYGSQSGQNTYFYVGALGTKFSLLMFDFKWVLGNNSFDPGSDLFTGNDQDPNTAHIFLEPAFRRMYWRDLKVLATGALNPLNSGALLDAKYNAFVANGLRVEDPNFVDPTWDSPGIKQWMSAACPSIAAQIAAEDTSTFTANSSVVVSNAVAFVSGVAPINVKTIAFNGEVWPMIWTSVTNWSVQLPVQAGTNEFSVVGLDINGNPIPGDTDVVTAVSANSAPTTYISYNSAGQIYTQNFDSLPNPGATSVNTANPVTINGITYSLANPFGFAAPIVASGNTGGLGIAALAGWYGMADPSASVGTRFGATDGDQTTGGILSFGMPNSGNRAVGLLATSTTGFTAFGVKFVNATAQTLTRMTLQFTGEVWRQSNLPKTLQFYYLVDPSALAAFSTNYTALLPSLNLSFPTVAADTGGVAVDGTSSLNQTNLGVVNQTINWPPGAALWLVWEMADPTGKSQGLGIDNLSFSATTQQTSTRVPLTIQLSGTHITLSWPAAPGQTYQPEYTDNLGSGNWVPIGPPIAGTGGVAVFSSDVTSSRRCFRLVILSQ